MLEQCDTYSMCGGTTHGSIPPFTRRQIWTVDLKFFPYRIPCCRRLQSAHVASMAKFRLRVTANDVVVEDLGHPVLLLFFGGLLAYRCHCMVTWSALAPR
jgi:hypothetical protein